MEFHLVPAAEISVDPLDVGSDSKRHLVDVTDRAPAEEEAPRLLEPRFGRVTAPRPRFRMGTLRFEQGV